MSPSASLGLPTENGHSKELYEPAHGSAPDIAGQCKANPIACILSIAMALRYLFAQSDEAARIEITVEKVLADGWRTADLLGEEGVTPVSATEMGDAILVTITTACKAIMARCFPKPRIFAKNRCPDMTKADLAIIGPDA